MHFIIILAAIWKMVSRNKTGGRETTRKPDEEGRDKGRAMELQTNGRFQEIFRTQSSQPRVIYGEGSGISCQVPETMRVES